MNLPLLLVFAAAVGPAQAEPVAVTDVQAVHRNGQTFVTWKDAAEGEAGAAFRYSLYRSDAPITQDNLAQAELCFSGVLNNSAKLFGAAFRQEQRLDPKKPTCIIEEGGRPLPMWSGLAVITTRKDGKAYYAVVATSESIEPLSAVVPGASATVEPVEEKVAAIAPIRTQSAAERGGRISGRKGLPLHVILHASDGGGGGAGGDGDYYLYFGNEAMGYRDGLPSVFCVSEPDRLTLRSMLSCGLSGAFDKDVRGPDGFKGPEHISLQTRDAIENPNGKSARETFWFGYCCVPQRAADRTARAYPFTEERLLWMVDWVSKKYDVDMNRRYCSGGSMGAWGTTSFAFRHPEIFAAVYPNRPRTRQTGLPGLGEGAPKAAEATMPDGETPYLKRMDSVAFASARHEALPFYGWCCGRRDGFATWKEQIDMVKAMTAAHHGFAFAFNNGAHQPGAKPMQEIVRYYPPDRFALNLSYPAFGNSSIDSNMGNGDPADGDMEGGVNLGFRWSDPVDEPDRWSSEIGNELAKADMTVDVTPRRCQRFSLKPGQAVNWTSSTGDTGRIVADEWGLATVSAVKIPHGKAVTLTISR